MIEPYYSRRRHELFVPGLVRMDRAILYIAQNLKRLINELELRQTKTLGESEYSIASAIEQVAMVCQMSGDPVLDRVLHSLVRVRRMCSSRTPRLEALKALRDYTAEIESYEPASELLSEDDDRGNGGGDVTPEKASPADVAKEGSLFVIMPFSQDFNDVWRGGILTASKANGFHPIRVDTINRSSNITDDIVDSIKGCKIAVVDVTGNNPNVMFELGYVMALEKPYVIISQSVDFLPFDIRHIRTIVYTNTWSGIEELKSKLQDFLKEFSSHLSPKNTTRKAIKKKQA